MTGDLTKGGVMKTMLKFSLPMILGNLLQQCYNVADTFIVGKYLGSDALAAVGSSFTLMTFLTSILLGLCMGSGASFSICFGRKDENGLKERMAASFLLIFLLSLILNLAVFLLIDEIIAFLRVPVEIREPMKEYLVVIFFGIIASFLYNYFASLLRAVGNSSAPLVFLAVSAVCNIVLDLWFVVGLKRGVRGAAEATVIAQYLSGIGIAVFSLLKFPKLRFSKKHFKIKLECVKEISKFSLMTCVQQSIMNLGILMVQGLVNSFGADVMAAFAVAVKIDAFAYMPVQDFGNAFSTFIAQNYGAKREDRIKAGLKGAVITALIFCVIISLAVFIFAKPLMMIFIDGGETAIIAEGVRYLRIEGAFYSGIGCLFLLYGLYRAVGKPGMSVVLTVVSLGTRVALAYLLSAIPAVGVLGIWWSVPIGWILADLVGLIYYKFKKDEMLSLEK